MGEAKRRKQAGGFNKKQRAIHLLNFIFKLSQKEIRRYIDIRFKP